MKPADFYDLTPRQFMNKLAGFHMLEKSRQKEEWERTRLTWTFIANWSGLLKTSKTPQDMMKFPWDTENAKPKPIMTRERFEQLKKRYN
jgi:hypothetical protein